MVLFEVVSSGVIGVGVEEGMDCVAVLALGSEPPVVGRPSLNLR